MSTTDRATGRTTGATADRGSSRANDRTAFIDIDARTDALREAVELARPRLPTHWLAPATTALARADERRAHGDALVVVALAGGTGTGKSSVLNALAGRPLARVDVRRPTTHQPTAWVVADPAEARPLLDWLEVPEANRHTAPRAEHHLDDPDHLDDADLDDLDGLVLLDLPDIDSVSVENHAVAGRLTQRVDIVVWVVDPLKYAQRSLHDGLLAELQAHAEVMLVVVNRIDLLAADDQPTCLADVERLVAGRVEPPVLATSTHTGQGIDELRERLATHVRERRAMAKRIAADIHVAADTLATTLATTLDPTPATTLDPTDDRGERPALDVDAEALATRLAAASGLDSLTTDAERAYLDDAARGARSPAARVLGLVLRVVARIARGLGATGRWLAGPGTAASQPRRAVARTTGAVALDVHHALLDVEEAVRRLLPGHWAATVAASLTEVGDRLARVLTDALANVEVRPAPRRWWFAVAALRTVAELAAVVGIGWLLAHHATGWLLLPAPPVVMLREDVSLPGVLVVAGVASWVLVGLLRRPLARRGAHRHAEQVTDEATRTLATTVRDEVLAPVEAELDIAAQLRSALARAAGQPIS